VSHVYLVHGGEKSQRNVVMYHHYDISESKQMNFRGMHDSIASSIWKQLDKFGSEDILKKFQKKNLIINYFLATRVEERNAFWDITTNPNIRIL
jgi:hypothetical protein